jgi:Ca2+/Na+ antiporter
MQDQKSQQSKPRGLPERLRAFQPGITMATGSIFGALLVLFFAVMYSHQIFFSDRWDSSATKYIELWFFTLAISVLVPALLRFVNKGLLAWYGRVCTVAAAAVMVVWLAGSWPTFVTENGYTAIGYMFRDNILLFQLALHLSATVVASTFLQQAAVHRDGKIAAFKDVSGMMLGAIILGAAMSACAAFFQYPGLHVVFVVAAASAVVLAIAGAIPHIARGAWSAMASPESTSSERDAPFQRGGGVRAFVFTGATIAVLLLSLAYLPEKIWETIATFIPLAYPIAEVIACLIYFIWSRAAKQTDAIRGYGDVGRSVVALIFAMLGIVLALLVSGYYRAMLDTMPWLAGAAACGLLIARVTRGRGTASSSARALQNHVVFLAGLAILAAVAITSGLTWLDHASMLDAIPLDLQDPSGVPFPGLIGVVPAGFGIGLLLACAVHGIGDYHQKAPLGTSGEPTWNANATIWFLMAIPGAFYMGQFYFENRIFEWYVHIQTNVEDTGTTVLAVGVVFAILVIALVPLLIRLIMNMVREKGKGTMQISKRLPRQQRWAGAAIIALVLAASLGGAAVVSVWQHTEPANHVLLFQNEAFTLWSLHPSEKVEDTYMHGTFSTTASEIVVTMAAGETERVHLVLTPRATIGQLRVNISSLHDSISGDDFPSNGSNWYFVTYNFDGQEEHLVPGNPGQYRGREILSAAYLSQINNWAAAPGSNQPLWLSFTSLYNTTAGTYAGNVTIWWAGNTGAESTTIPVRVTVLAYQKPLAYRFSTAIGTSQGAAAARGRSLWRHGRMGYESGFPEMLLPKFWTIDWTTGVFTLNYTSFYNALNACAQAGYTIQKYLAFSGEMLTPSAVSPSVPFSALWNSTVLAIVGNASLDMNITQFDLPNGQGKIRAIDMFYDDLYDEPGNQDAWRFRFGQILNRAANVTGVKWRLLCTCGISLEAASWPGWSGPGGVYDVVDIRVQGPLGFQFYRDDPQVRYLADVVYPAEEWVYWINSPWPPAPNSAQAYNPGSAVFSQAVQYYTISNVSGYYFWTSGDTAWADGGDGYAGWGSGKYFYPAGDGSGDWDPGYRFEMLDDGLEVGELLRHLDAMIANSTLGPLNAVTLQQAVGIRDKFEAMFPDFYTYPRPDRVGDLYALRLELLQFLVDNA